VRGEWSVFNAVVVTLVLFVVFVVVAFDIVRGLEEVCEEEEGEEELWEGWEEGEVEGGPFCCCWIA